MDQNIDRLIAVGDIHGHLGKLCDLMSQIQPTKHDQLVFLGDYIDRGLKAPVSSITSLGFEESFQAQCFCGETMSSFFSMPWFAKGFVKARLFVNSQYLLGNKR